MPENQQPESQPGTEPPAETAVSEKSQAAPDAPDASQTGSEEHSPAGSEVVTTYEQTPEGHRITRRTVHRTETVEERQETIEERFPVAAPTPYAPPDSDHPAPVG